LLLQIDALPSYVVVVVATNHPELLDRAVWRRFQVRLHLPQPSAAQREHWFERMRDAGLRIGLSPRTLATRFPSGSFSDLEDFALDLQRRIVLEGPGVEPSKLARRLLAERREMYAPKRSK
jgi:SpoVK/Ycf46/Vps4 family AAA+-type ATPase